MTQEESPFTHGSSSPGPATAQARAPWSCAVAWRVPCQEPTLFVGDGHAGLRMVNVGCHGPAPLAGPCARRFARTLCRRRGLTLIELMVAMTASAVIFLAALRAFQQGKFVGTHIDREMTRAAGLYDLWQLLASDVGGSFVLASPQEAGAWVGGPDSMRFLAVRPEGRPVEIEYRFEKAKPGTGPAGQIVRSTRFCSGSVPIGPWERTVVAENVLTFALRYGATAEGTDALAWVTEFRSQQAAPRAVEVQVVRAGPQGENPEPCRWVIASRAQVAAGGGT